MLGATDDDLAGLFEVEPATIADWIAGFPDFAAACQRGRWRDKVEPEAHVSNDFLAELDAASERARNFARDRG
jgi:hypothetical protein